MNRSRYYELKPDGTTTPVTDVLALNWDIAHRRVDWTKVGQYEVSTVFLGIDHRHFGDGPPLLFETMVFGLESSDDLYCDRYSTKAAAQAGHDQVVAALRDGVEPGEIRAES